MKITALAAMETWRRWYLSWFARYGLRVSVAVGTAWMVLMMVCLVDGPREPALLCWAGASCSFYVALSMHDNPADPDDPEQDYF